MTAAGGEDVKAGTRARFKTSTQAARWVVAKIWRVGSARMRDVHRQHDDIGERGTADSSARVRLGQRRPTAAASDVPRAYLWMAAFLLGSAAAAAALYKLTGLSRAAGTSGDHARPGDDDATDMEDGSVRDPIIEYSMHAGGIAFDADDSSAETSLSCLRARDAAIEAVLNNEPGVRVSRRQSDVDATGPHSGTSIGHDNDFNDRPRQESETAQADPLIGAEVWSLHGETNPRPQGRRTVPSSSWPNIEANAWLEQDDFELL